MSIKKLAVAAMLATIGSAQASSSVTASITDFSVLVNKGSFNWDTGTLYTEGSADASDQDGPVFPGIPGPSFSTTLYHNASGSDFALFGNISDHTLGAVSLASYSSFGNGMSVSVSTPDSGGVASAGMHTIGQFILGANSSVTFKWNASATGVNTGGDFFNYSLGYDGSTADAHASIQIDVPTKSSIDASGGSNFLVPEDNGFEFNEVGTNKTLTVFNKSLTATRRVYFVANVSANSYDLANTPAVPEPEVWAMGIAGLAVVSSMARRRRAN